jgi:steroid 5-alpha reductase family enzyme
MVVASFFRVFLLQGVLLWIISIPLLAAQYGANPDQLIITDYLGLLVWMVGFFFEATGDYQLTRFIKNPQNKGKILSDGVWRYTRHPNYFGDATQWCGYFLVQYPPAVGGLS